MIDFILSVNESPKKKIGKTLTDDTTFSCLLKEDTSILNPVLILESEVNMSKFNYMYCQEFRRYYFINDIESIGNNLWKIKSHVDVLETYKLSILSNKAVVKRQENKYNLYLDDPDFHVYNYEKIQTLQFPANSFMKSLQYVLVTNGAGSSSEENFSQVKIKGGEDNGKDD